MSSESPLKTRIQNDMKAAMRAKEKARLGTVRMLLAAIKQREIDDQSPLSDEQVLGVIEKMLKQRRDSIKQYESADRPELAEIEKAEMAVLQAYMPGQMSDEEIETLVTEFIKSSGARGPQDMGKVMSAIKPKVQGRADMGRVSQLVKAKINAL